MRSWPDRADLAKNVGIGGAKLRCRSILFLVGGFEVDQVTRTITADSALHPATEELTVKVFNPADPNLDSRT